MIDPAWVEVGLTVIGGVGTVVIRGAFQQRDEKIDSLRGTQKLLFEKLDAIGKELHEYKLHVAETYVNEQKLEKMLDPINRRLESIENDLRQERARA